MKRTLQCRLIILALLGISSSIANAVETTIKLKGNFDEESSITVRKGSPAPSSSETSDFEMISGDEAVYGDPVLGQTESYASWKEACAIWKQEVKDLNKGNQIILINCNRPTSTSEKNGLVTHHSRGTYKIRIPLKKALKTSVLQNAPAPSNTSTP
jgi:hypothetical protein